MTIKKAFHKKVIINLSKVEKYKEYSTDQWLTLVHRLFPEYRKVENDSLAAEVKELVYQ